LSGFSHTNLATVLAVVAAGGPGEPLLVVPDKHEGVKKVLQGGYSLLPSNNRAWHARWEISSAKFPRECRRRLRD